MSRAEKAGGSTRPASVRAPVPAPCQDRPLPPEISWAPAPATGSEAAQARRGTASGSPASSPRPAAREDGPGLSAGHPRCAGDDCPAPRGTTVSESACCFGLSDVAAEDFRKGAYQVVHYAPAAYGLAHGPLSLAQVLRFCEDLTSRLRLFERVVFQHGPTVAERANCAVLLGAFLVMCRGWSAGMVAEALRDEAELGFVCSWAQAKNLQAPVMRVKDCWDGLDLAGSRGWLRLGAWQPHGPEDARLEAQLVDFGVSQYTRLALQYDAAWLVPAEILVMADPITTIKDPNPATCPSFGPPAGAAEEQDGDLEPNTPVSERDSSKAISHVVAEEPARRPSTSAPHLALLTSEPGPSLLQGLQALGKPEEAPASMRLPMVKVDSTKTCGTRIEPDSLDSECVDGLMMLGDANDKEDRNTSLHSVCKAYQSADAYSPEQVSRPKALDFISLLRKHGVGTVVRTNASNEEGLREVGGSYDPAALREQSIHHLDFFVKDVNGGIPPPRLIMSFLQEMDRTALRGDAGSQPAAEGEARVPTPVSGGSRSSPASEEAPAPAVVVHCKSGFGRSMLFACLLVIHKCDVPGRALLGWARMVRPGAFTVPEQERFLCSLGGREDLHRYAGLASPAPCKCCSVQ